MWKDGNVVPADVLYLFDGEEVFACRMRRPRRMVFAFTLYKYSMLCISMCHMPIVNIYKYIYQIRAEAGIEDCKICTQTQYGVWRLPRAHLPPAHKIRRTTCVNSRADLLLGRRQRIQQILLGTLTNK